MTTDFFDISHAARLLIVDHDADTRDLICGVLSEEGFDVKALDNGLLAWELLQYEEFELKLNFYGIFNFNSIFSLT